MINRKVLNSILMLVSLFYSCFESGKEEGPLRDGSGEADGNTFVLGRGNLPVSRKAIPLPQGRKKWTVLVHMDGDNNLSGFSTLDIKEMMGAGSGNSMNIVVLWDNDPTQESGAQDRHGYYYIEKSGARLLYDTGEVNMGAAGTAKKFIDYSLKNFPADRYMWVFWNHGGAVDRSARGVSWDDTNGGDHLTETEQKEIMKYFAAKSGRKFDIVGFDACLMATAEIAYQYRGAADYLVASEQTIPGNGWDYGFLARINSNPSITPKTLAKYALTYFKNYYVKSADGNDTTLSVIDLAYAGELAAAVDGFSSAAMKSGVARDVFKQISGGLPVFGYYTSGGKKYYYTKDLAAYFDAAAISPNLPQSLKDKAGKIISVIRGTKLVVAEWHGAGWRGKASGISMTFKYATKTYRELDFCKDTSWDEFLNWAGFPNNDYVY